MNEFQEIATPEEMARYRAYDRIMGNISWLLIALVSLDIKLLPSGDEGAFYLALLCVLLLVYNMGARYLPLPSRHGRFKTFIDLMVFLFFIVAVSWFTGRTISPFISLIYLVLMATSLTQGRRVTYFMAALAITSYALLAMQDDIELLSRTNWLRGMLELFPFMLIAHLGAMLSGEAESARREIERLSFTDEVTGLNNMRNFFNLSGAQEKQAIRYGKPFAICMVDADNLKKINDLHGHFAGTELIRHVARIIVNNLRDADIAARYGGDEFVIMFTETTKQQAAEAVRRIVETLAATPFSHQGILLSTTLSAGLAGFPEDGADVRTVMANADAAMYSSKKNGKNRSTLYLADRDRDAVSCQA